MHLFANSLVIRNKKTMELAMEEPEENPGIW